MDPYALPRGHEPADAEDIISSHRDKPSHNSGRLKAGAFIANQAQVENESSSSSESEDEDEEDDEMNEYDDEEIDNSNFLDYNQANNIFKNILEKSPMNINMMLNCAKCYEKLEDIDSALAQLDKIVDIMPDCEEAQEMIRKLS